MTTAQSKRSKRSKHDEAGGIRTESEPKKTDTGRSDAKHKIFVPSTTYIGPVSNHLPRGHRCIRKLFGLDSETCIPKLFPVDSETFPGGFGNFPVGFGNFPGCIRELVYSGNWDLVTKPLSSETFPRDS